MLIPMPFYGKMIIYIALIVGAFIVFLTKGGIDYFIIGDYVRGFFFVTVAVLTIVGWLAPLTSKYRSVGIAAARWLALLLALISAFIFVRTYFVESLPVILP